MGLWTYSPIGLGQVGDPDTVNGIGQQVQQLSGPGWQNYTPVLTTSGTAPTLGNGTIVGRYRKPSGSDLAIVHGIVTLGSTSNIGTGFIFVSLPFAASAVALSQLMMGNAVINDSGGVRMSAVCFLQSATTLAFCGNSGNVSNTWQTWNTGDYIAWSIQFEPA